MTEDCEAVRVTPESSDVLMEPVEGGDLVHQAIVGHGPLVRVLVCVEKTCRQTNVLFLHLYEISNT